MSHAATILDISVKHLPNLEIMCFFLAGLAFCLLTAVCEVIKSDQKIKYVFKFLGKDNTFKHDKALLAQDFAHVTGNFFGDQGMF